MSMMLELTKAENLYAKFVRFKGLVGRDYEDLLNYLCSVLRQMPAKNRLRKDVIQMLEEVVHAQGIPGAMYGHNHPYTGEYYMDMTFTHKTSRDKNGRWVMTTEMIENDVPVVIDWQEEEDWEWQLNQEYAEAYNATSELV